MQPAAEEELVPALAQDPTEQQVGSLWGNLGETVGQAEPQKSEAKPPEKKR